MVLKHVDRYVCDAYFPSSRRPNGDIYGQESPAGVLWGSVSSLLGGSAFERDATLYLWRPVVQRDVWRQRGAIASPDLEDLGVPVPSFEAFLR